MRRLPGITLLEMLVALALTGLVLVLLVQIMQLSGRAAASAAGVRGDAERLAIRREIRGAFAKLLIDPAVGYTLDGDSQRAVFFAKQRIDAFPDAYAVEVDIATGNGQLVLTRKILDANQALLGTSRQVAPLDGGTVQIEYLPPCLFAGEWQPDWKLDAQPAVAMRIIVNEGAFWPDFVIARPPMVQDGC
ncbi:MAG: hypothetical protein AAFV38_11595 [Pseudomonadota bacterium]